MSTKMKTYSHDELVKKARKWLWAQGCAIVITEMSSGTQEPDVIGWHHNYSILVECKASRADFLSNKHKSYHRIQTSMGDRRYYLAPKGIIKQGELPEGWGLLEPHGNGVTIKESWVSFLDKNWQGEISLLISAMRRVNGLFSKGTSVRQYFYQTKCRATLGIKKDGVA